MTKDDIMKYNHSNKLSLQEKFAINRMSIKDLTSLDPNIVNGIKKPLLEALVKKASQYANRNLKDAERKGITSPGLYNGFKRAKEKGRMYTSNGLSLNKLKSEFRAVTAFLDNDTRTIAGAKKFNEDLKKRLMNQAYGDNISKKDFKKIENQFTKENLNKLWETYHKYQETPNNYFGSLGSHKIQAIVTRSIIETNFDVDSALEKIEKVAKQEYEDFSLVDENPFD